MKISELIVQLQDELQAFGDLPVEVGYGCMGGLVASEDVWCVGETRRGKEVVGYFIFLQSANNADDASEEAAERAMQRKEALRRKHDEIHRYVTECIKRFPANGKETS